MEVGVHLPQCRFDGRPVEAGHLLDYARTARGLGFSALAANDHFVFSRPWLDGLTLLAAVAAEADGMDLATTVALPTLRGPAPLAAALSTLDTLTAGRVIAGLGPGSSPTDYAVARVRFDERWARFDAAVEALVALLHQRPLPSHWSEPLPPDQVSAASVAPGKVAVWIASWGSAAGMRRVARLADGWLASAYHASIDDFAVARRLLAAELDQQERAPLPSAVATMWTYVTDDEPHARRVLDDVLAPALGRDAAQLRPRVCVGSAETCIDLLGRYREAGCDRIHLWPVADELEQLHRIAGEVVPHVVG